MAKPGPKVPLEARALMLAPLSLICWGALVLVAMFASGIANIDISAHSARWFFPTALAVSGVLAGLMAGWTIARFDAMYPKRTGTKWLYFLAASPFGLGLFWGLEGAGTDDAMPLWIFLLPFAGCAAGIALHRHFRK